GEASCEKGQFYKPVTVEFSFFQFSGSQLISNQDAASAGQSVAQAAYKIPYHRGYRICCCGGCAQMPHKCGIGSKADTPGQGSSQDRQRVPEEILFQPALSVKQPFPLRMYVAFPVRTDHYPAQLQDPGDQCGKGGSFFIHCRKSEKTVDKDCIEDNIAQYG